MRPRPLIAAAAAVAVAVVLTSLAGCDKREDASRSPLPPPVGSAVALPDPLTLDWKNLVYDLGALGVVRTTAGRADLGFLEGDDGLLHATQDPQVVAEGAGSLVLDPPSFGDLDRDGHDEALIPYELDTVAGAPPSYGVFVFTLRGGTPIQLARIETPAKGAFAIEGDTLVIGPTRLRWDAAINQLAPVR